MNNTPAVYEDADDETRLEILAIFLGAEPNSQFAAVAQVVREQLNILVNARVQFITMTTGKGFSFIH